MRNTIKMLLWGLAGLTLTGALTLGAFAIAGKSLSSPAIPLRMVVPSLVEKGPQDAKPSPTPSHHRNHHHKPPPPSPHPSPVPTAAPASPAPPVVSPTDDGADPDHHGDPHSAGDD